MTSALTLARGREKTLLRRHPWIFSGAVARADAAASGETVDVLAADGRWLAKAAFSPSSQIRARVWSFDPSDEIDAAFMRRRLRRAIAVRAELGHTAQGACRLVHAEADGLPGLIVDRYGEHLVCQFLAAGVERHKSEIVAALGELLSPRGVFERSDSEARGKEGLEPRVGTLWGEEPPAELEIDEGGLRFLVDVRQGHKTGFYLDQRLNRELLARFAADRDVLNAFAYTGAFTAWALQGGARRVTQIETSGPSLELARKMIEHNGFADREVESIADDVFKVLRRFRDAGRGFDVIVLDPPKFAASAAQVERAARGYKDINLLALKLLRPGGVLFTFSCSGHVKPPLFQKIVADSAADAGREVQIVRFLSQAEDHPVALHVPETQYLKGLVCRVITTAEPNPPPSKPPRDDANSRPRPEDTDR